LVPAFGPRTTAAAIAVAIAITIEVNRALRTL
jgi:hypothetical protein